MAAETAEIGLQIGSTAPNFALLDHERQKRDLASIMGEKGVIIGFIKDIWQPASIRRILYMQKHHRKFHAQGYNIALIIADQPHTLYSFHLSSEVKVSLPLLADPDESAHCLFRMDHSALVMIDNKQVVRAKWLIPAERVWLRPKELMEDICSV